MSDDDTPKTKEVLEEVRDGFADPTYFGPYPPFLYRYRGLTEKGWEAKLDKEIGLLEIFLAPFKWLNDPEEGAIDFRFAGTEEEIRTYFTAKLSGVQDLGLEGRVRHILDHGGHPPDAMLEAWSDAIGDNFRLACFSEDHLNPIMWTHYASFQKADGTVVPQGGICLQYMIDEDFRRLGLAPVEYVNRRPLLNLLSVEKDQSSVRRVMFQKGPAWSVEREWRVFLNFGPEAIGKAPQSLHASSRLRFSEGTLSAVIFGLNTPREVKDRVAAIAKKHAFKPTLMQVVRDRVTMNFRLDGHS